MYTFGLVPKDDARPKIFYQFPFSFFSNYGMDFCNYGMGLGLETQLGIAEGVAVGFIPSGSLQEMYGYQLHSIDKVRQPLDHSQTPHPVILNYGISHNYGMDF